jgi:hypothetical protein
MSALSQLLAQHSADIEARIQHTNDVDNEIADRKANTLEEKFQHAKDAIEGVGAELGAAGAAFHVGRKVYTKYKARQARLAKEKTGEGDSASTDVDDAKFQARPGEPSQPRTAAEAATDEPAPSSIAEGGARGGAAEPELGSIAEEPDVIGGERTRAARFEDSPESQAAQDKISAEGRARQSAAESEHPEASSEPRAAESQPAQDLGDAGTAEGQENRAANIESAQAEAPTGTEEANPMEAFNTRAGTPLQAGGSQPVDRPTSEANVSSAAEGAGTEGGEGASRAASIAQSGDVEEGSLAFMNPETGEARAASSIASRAADNSSIIDKGINGAKKIGSAIKGGLSGDASTATEGILPEVGEALDFLGPVGEFAGLITGLVGLFEGLGHKKAAPPEMSGQSGQVALQTAGAGIDPKALLAGQPKGLMASV